MNELLLSERLLIEAEALIYSDPSRSSRLRHCACVARKMEGAMDDVVAGAQDQVVDTVARAARASWVEAARSGSVVVHVGKVEEAHASSPDTYTWWCLNTLGRQ